MYPYVTTETFLSWRKNEWPENVSFGSLNLWKSKEQQGVQFNLIDSHKVENDSYGNTCSWNFYKPFVNIRIQDQNKFSFHT